MKDIYGDSLVIQRRSVGGDHLKHKGKGNSIDK